MSRVLSLRLPAVLERAVRNHAAQSRMPVPDLVRLILEHSLGGPYRFSELRAVAQSLDAKLDVRLPEELVAKLRGESARLGIPVSVYSRVILYAFYTKRLVVVQIGGRYTLAENHDQTKRA